MKVFKHICLTFCSFCIAVLLIGIPKVMAMEITGGTKVEIQYTKDNKYLLEVIVKEGGDVFDGIVSSQQKDLSYYMPLETTQELTIYAKKGYRLQKVTYYLPEFNRKTDISHMVNNNKLSIASESTKMQVIIEFEKLPVDNSKVEKPNQGQTSTSPKTNDSSNYINTYIFLLFISTIMLGYLLKKNKTE